MTDQDHALSGAYAVDALDADERARFEAHLRHCADCQAEVDGLRETAAMLSTDDLTPPASVRDAVLAGITAIRPLPPISEQPDEPANPAANVTPLAPRRLRPQILRGLLVAAAVVLLAAGALVFRPWSDDTNPPAKPQLTAAERVLAAPDAVDAAQSFPDGSTATVTVSRSEGRAVIRTEHMALAPEGRVYQLWLQTPDGAMVSAGLMPDDADATVLLNGDATRATGVGISVEPDGGSPQPSTQPIAYFALAS